MGGKWFQWKNFENLKETQFPPQCWMTSHFQASGKHLCSPSLCLQGASSEKLVLFFPIWCSEGLLINDNMIKWGHSVRALVSVSCTPRSCIPWTEEHRTSVTREGNYWNEGEIHWEMLYLVKTWWKTKQNKTAKLRETQGYQLTGAARVESTDIFLL